MMVLYSAQLSQREERLGSNYLRIITENIYRFLPRLINEAPFHITAFARLLNMWPGVMATRIESGEGTLLSPAQAWNSKYDKFPFEFLEFNDAIEANITELFELYYQDLEEENNNPELTTCSADSSSSDDDEPCGYDLTNEAMELNTNTVKQWCAVAPSPKSTHAPRAAPRKAARLPGPATSKEQHTGL